MGGPPTVNERPRRAAVEGFPPALRSRYEPIRLLGEGGMGRVFLARDLRLRREVAVKFVRDDDPELAQRILAEARAQARVDDPRVCKVYDVGEVDGRVHIAMQHVDGRPLTELVTELSYEQKALVMRGAALGVHAAHRAGLIHRDLKPSNILVERSPDGELRPFVLDFGIARDWTASTTATGTVLGTPQFMAPEQARGEVKQLDRRADVYSLGATFYALLTDHAPIEGENQLVVLNRVALEEPPRPRTHDPDLPLDLDAIVMKCLERERAARYDSARALADDLGRFLDGQPVEARATVGARYWLRTRLRRHWRGLAVALALVAIAAVALGFVVRERWAAERRTELARRFTEQVEGIEALARYAALAPPHDLRRDRAQLRARMDALAAEVRTGGDDAAGPGRYALGRGHLALGDDERAFAELDQAWAHGFREPRAAYALAIALGRLYQRGLREAERLTPDDAAARRRQLEARYREPARAYLRASEGATVPSRHHVTALLAYYEGRFDEALAALGAIDDELAWFYEAPLLRGDILRDRARTGGGTPAQVAADLDAARVAYAAAGAIGESDPAVHLAVANLEYLALADEMYGSGAIDAPLARGLAAADRALQVLPDSVDALVLRAQLRRSAAEHRSNRGEEVDALLTAALADAGRAVELSPTAAPGLIELACAHRQLGEVRLRHGQDPDASLAEAATLLGRVAPADRDHEFHVHLGLVHKLWADHLDSSGRDAAEHRQLAIAAYTQALALNERRGSAWLNLAINYHDRASHAPPDDARVDDDIAQGLAALERAKPILAGHFVPYFYEGELRALDARRVLAQGRDPDAELTGAIAAYQTGLAIQPGQPNLLNGVSIAFTERGRAAAAHGRDPQPLFAEARVAAEQAVNAAPLQPFGYSNVGYAIAERARVLAAGGGDPRPLAAEANTWYARALERAPDHAEILLNLASSHTLVARHQVELGLDPRESLAGARQSIARARVGAPDAAEAARLTRECDELAARWAARPRR